MSDGKEVGAIPQKSTREIEGEKKVKHYKKLSMGADDAVYLADEMTFYIHGKNSTIVNVECVVRVTLSEMVSMFGPVFMSAIVPMTYAAQEQIKKANATIKV